MISLCRIGLVISVSTISEGYKLAVSFGIAPSEK